MLPLVLAVVGAAVILLLGGTARGVVLPAFGVLGAVAVLSGILRERPRFAPPWYLVLAGLAMLAVADVVRAAPGPATAGEGALSLAGHLLLVAALALIVRGHLRDGERGIAVEAALLGVAVALILWVCLLGPLVYGSSAPALVRAVLAVDVPLAGLAAWLALASGGRRRSPPLDLIAAGVAALLVGDALYAADGGGSPAALVWVISYALFGASALHPAMGGVAETSPERRAPFGARGAAVIAVGILVVPLALIVQTLRGEPVDVPAVAVGSVALFALSLLRLRGLDRAQAPRRESNGGSARADSVLASSATALVAAADRRSAYEAALGAARALLSRDGNAGAAAIALGTADDMEVVAATGAVGEGERLRLRPAELKALIRKRSVAVRQEDHPALAIPQGPAGPEAEHFLAPIVVGGKLGGIVQASTGSPIETETRRAVEDLARQTSAALERIDSTEARHRRRTRERFESLTRNVSDVIMVVKKDGVVRYASPSCAGVLGHDPRKLVGGDVFDLVHRGDASQARKTLQRALKSAGAGAALEARMRHSDGSWCHMEGRISNLLEDPNVRGLVINVRDGTDRKRTAEQLTHQAFYDPLTELPNRELLMDRLGRALARSGRPEESVAVISCNLDRFKLVNDSLGHEAGDQLLIAVGRRLKAALRPEDTVARMGGDEFVVLIEDVESVSQVIFLAERVIKLFEAPFTYRDRQAYTTISAGIAISRTLEDSPSDLLRDADIALHRAKAKGKGRYEVFDAEMGTQALRQLERDTELRRAIDRNEFVVYYQPKLDLSTGRLHGFEALVRWIHPERGLVPPGLFIPLAEESGLIVRIGHWVLEESCRRAKTWQDRYGEDAPAVGVNLSAQQFRHPRLPELVAAALEETKLPPDALLLEVTESAMMEDAEASSATLTSLKELGVRIAIDDFGTGYSSLAYLKRFPLDMLKIDRSFVNELGHDPKSNAIVEAVCALGNTLQMQVLAEGVETARQATLLREMGCELGQGYFFSRPVPQKDAEELILQYPGARSSH